MRPAYPELMESVQRVARVVKDEEHRYADHLPGGREGVPRRGEGRRRRRAPRRRWPSSSTTPTAWRSTSRRRWRASAASPSTARASSARWSSSASAPAPVGRAPSKAQIAPAYQDTARAGPHAVPGLRRAGIAASPRGRPAGGPAAGGRARARRQGRSDARRDAVLRRSRRAGGRPRRALLARRARRWRTSKAPIRAVAGLTVHRVIVARAAFAPATSCAPRSARAAARRHHAQPHRHAPAARRAARRARARTSSRPAAWWSPARLRFDFTHYAAVDRAEMEEVERLVNEQILRNAERRRPM